MPVDGTRKINYLLPNRFNKETNEYEAELYTNVAQNVYMGVNTEKTVADYFEEIKSRIEECGGSGGVVAEVSMTYAELKSEKVNSTLIPGQRYLLTDYATKYRQPQTNVIKTTLLDGRNERLVLMAVSEKAFSTVAASIDYPEDIVYYDFDDNICEDGTTPRTGFIQRRVDTVHNIDVPHDWRTMLWARCKIIPTKTWTSGSVGITDMYLNGGKVYIVTKQGTPANATDANYFGYLCDANDYVWAQPLWSSTFDTSDYAERYTFNFELTDYKTKTAKKHESVHPENIVIKSPAKDTLHNNVFYFTSEDNKPVNNFLDSGCINNSFGCTSDEYMRNNVFGTNCIGNVFMWGSKNNIFGKNCSRNYSNSGSTWFHDNYIGNSMNGNFIFSTFNNNSMFNTGSGNMFVKGFLENITEKGFGGNSFNCSVVRCVFEYCYGSTFQNVSSFDYNYVQMLDNKDVSNIAELFGKTYQHTIYKNSAGAHYALHYVGTTPTYTSIP